MLEERLERSIAILGKEKFDKLVNASVMVVGVGAVGGYALEMVARLGVKNIIVVDFDCFEKSNINRQILANVDTIGMKKVDVALERVSKINPDAKVLALDLKVCADNLDFILAYKPCFVIDAIDDVVAKAKLIEFLVLNNIKFVSAMGAALKFRPELLKISKLDKTTNCHLAKKLRDILRKNNVNLKKVDVVFSTEETKSIKDSNGNNVLGSLALVPMGMGALLASKMFEEIVGKEN